ncbi:NACHT and TPR domain protein [Fusarium sp. NRRL 52700]|nr:NACHT and TPR domain protein [Fusarium sp. NRRL 52700]
MSDSKDEGLHLLWEDAIRQYKQNSKNGNDLKEGQLTVNTTSDLKMVLAQHESSFSGFRNRHGRFWGVFKGTMMQLQNIGKVVQAGVGLTPFAPASVIVEAGLFLITSSQSVTDTYDSLEKLFEKIGDVTGRVDEYLDGKVDPKLRKIITELLCSILTIFQEAEILTQRSRSKEMLRRIAGRENKIKGMLEELEKKLDAELRFVVARTYAKVKGIDEKADAERNQELIRKALHTSAVLENERTYARIKESTLKASGDWLLRQMLVKQWIDREFPVLWLHGKPGAGKTYLACRMISYLRESRHLNTAFFFIRESMNTQHTPEVILRTMAYQITELNDAYRSAATAVCQRQGSLFSPQSIWKSLFLDQFQETSMLSEPLFIVIDGVDEAAPDDQVLLVKMAKNLSDIRNKNHGFPAIQLVLIGRPDLSYHVSNEWGGGGSRPQTLHMYTSASKGDIERFIKDGMEAIPLLKNPKWKESPKKKKNLKRLRSEIFSTLSTNSDGMFMLAKLMLEEIHNMNKPELIREALSRPPVDLGDMFNRVIARLTVTKGFDTNDLNEIILWVAYAQRDLFLYELDLVVKLRDLEQGGIPGLDNELRTRFGSFFSVVYPETDGADSENDGVIAGSDSLITLAPSQDISAADVQEEMDTESDNWTDIENEASVDDESDDKSDWDEDTTPDTFRTATVKFSHASVGQHFREAPFYMGIGVDGKLAQARLATTCVRFLNGNIPKRNDRAWRQPDLYQYAADHFLDHFVKMSLTGLKSYDYSKYIELSDEFMTLFKCTTSLVKWFHSVSDQRKFMCQLFSQRICEYLQEWVSDHKALSEAATEAQGLKEENPSLNPLDAFAKAVAVDWLSWDDLDGIEAMIFLHGYKSTREAQPWSWTLPPNRPFEHIAERISPAMIQETISLLELSTENMHHSLGLTFMRIKTAQHLQASVEEFRLALNSHSGLVSRWKVFRDLAKVFIELQRWDEAVNAAYQAIKIIPKFHLHWKAALFLLIEQASIAAWELNPYSSFAVSRLIHTSNKVGDFGRTVRIIRSLFLGGERERGTTTIGEMLNTFRYAGEFISFACAATDQLSVARDAFTAVANQATKDHDNRTRAIAENALGMLYYQYYQEENKATDIWETILKDRPDTEGAVKASLALVPLYFDHAMSTGTSPGSSRLFDLSKLATKLSSSAAKWTSAAAHISALTGRYYRLQGDQDLARQQILPLAQLALRNLTDTDAENDYWAYINLGQALVCFGDRHDAEIAFAFTKPLREIK